MIVGMVLGLVACFWSYLAWSLYVH
jgi:hypothetical protein